MSGFPTTIRTLVYARAGSRCERCGVYAYGGSLHHRRPRGMGGTKDPAARSAANALLLCGTGTTGCHGWVESHRADALELGLLVRQGHDPHDVPATIRIGRVLLGEHGEYLPTAADEVLSRPRPRDPGRRW